MKITVSKIARAIVALSVPLLIMTSCESDLVDPENAMPPKSKIKIPPGAN